MKQELLNHPFHNPFYNRFNDPVRRRHDDMQAHAYTVWLRDRNGILPPRDMHHADTAEELPNVSSKHVAGMFAAALVVAFVVMVSAAVLLRAF